MRQLHVYVKGVAIYLTNNFSYYNTYRKMNSHNMQFSKISKCNLSSKLSLVFIYKVNLHRKKLYFATDFPFQIKHISQDVINLSAINFDKFTP